MPASKHCLAIKLSHHGLEASLLNRASSHHVPAAGSVPALVALLGWRALPRAGGSAALVRASSTFAALLLTPRAASTAACLKVVLRSRRRHAGLAGCWCAPQGSKQDQRVQPAGWGQRGSPSQGCSSKQSKRRAACTSRHSHDRVRLIDTGAALVVSATRLALCTQEARQHALCSS